MSENLTLREARNDTLDKPTILLVADDLDDISLVKSSFQRAGTGYPLQVVRSAEQAQKYLKGELIYSNRSRFPLPGLVLLDLKSGSGEPFEFLTWLRSQSALKAIPIIVLSSPEQIHDVNRAYQLGANSFLVKPNDFDNFIETSRQLQRHWLGLSRRSQTEDRRRLGNSL